MARSKSYAEIQNIIDPKTKLFAIIDKIDELKTIRDTIGLSDKQQFELENLQVLQMNAYSDWKDPD